MPFFLYRLVQKYISALHLVLVRRWTDGRLVLVDLNVYSILHLGTETLAPLTNTLKQPVLVGSNLYPIAFSDLGTGTEDLLPLLVY